MEGEAAGDGVSESTENQSRCSCAPSIALITSDANAGNGRIWSGVVSQSMTNISVRAKFRLNPEKCLASLAIVV